jgi:hypothetical protein
VADDVGALVAVVDGDLGGLADRLGAVLAELGDEDPAVVGAVVEVAGAVEVGELCRVEGPFEVVGVAAGPGAGSTTGSPESVQGPVGLGAVATPMALSLGPAVTVVWVTT